MSKNDLAMLVLSCDAYSDLWDDFFNLREKFWPDCPFKWYVVTESEDYHRDGVEVIKCGKDKNWAARYRMAVKKVNTPYVAPFLEDYFIAARIDNQRICNLLDLVEQQHVDFLDLGNIFRHKIDHPDREYYAVHLVVIPKHMRYGIDTAPAIWNSNYLLDKLGEDDYSAWRFEKDRCDEAASEEGYNGLILADDRLSFNVSEVPVVVQGMFYPPVIEHFRKRGYEINTSKRQVMSRWQWFKYDFKRWCSRIPFGHRFMKWIGSNLFGYKFFT